MTQFKKCKRCKRKICLKDGNDYCVPCQKIVEAEAREKEEKTRRWREELFGKPVSAFTGEEIPNFKKEQEEVKS